MVGAIIAIVFLALLWALVIFLNLPLLIAIGATVAIVVVAILVFVWKRFKARKAAGEIEKALASQADAQSQSVRPDQQADIQAMQAEFHKAIQSLKNSKLARGGSDALAVLPWYVIIGPPGSGKSTALRNSGLQFPYLSARGGVRGVGGTRNCDWWLTNEAVVLDTAGRYTTEEEDRDEWFSFLDTLARTRPRKPINGVLVAVSLSDLGGENEEGVIDFAKGLRERVDEVMQRLSMVLPVYLVFTKCDLLPGFVESFSDLRKNERGQIWGFTVPIYEPKENPGEIFRERFEEILGCVEERALQRMGQEMHIEGRERIYQFPQQLAFLENNLAYFVDTLFATNVYQDTPIMRGVYFTSGTQEGRTIDRVMNAMAEAFGIRPPAAAQDQVVEAKSYFLRDVFKNIIFPDQEVAVRNAKAVQQQTIQRYFLAAVIAIATVLLLIFPVRSFVQNRALIQSTHDVVDAVAGKLAPQQPNSNQPPPLAELEPLREKLSELERYNDEGSPFAMRFGMFQGGSLREPLQGLYIAAARRIVIDPVFKKDVDDMELFSSVSAGNGAVPSEAEHARYYEMLKMHLYLTAPRDKSEPRITESDQGWLTQQLSDRWSKRISMVTDPEAPRHIQENAALYVKLLAADPDNNRLALPRYERTVERTRVVLKRVSLASLALAKLASEAQGKGYEQSLTTMLGSTIQSLRGDAIVHGAYTMRGYEDLIKKRLDDPAGLLEYWVLSLPSTGDASASRQIDKLRSLYYQQYVTEWKTFLEQIRMNAEPGTIEVLRELTRGEPAVFPRLFQAVAYNTRMGGLLGALQKASGSRIDKFFKDKLGKDGAKMVQSGANQFSDDDWGPQDVEQFFKNFVDFGVAPKPPPQLPGSAPPPPPPKNVPLDIYQEQMTLLRDAIQTWNDNPGTPPPRDQAINARGRISALIEAQEIGFARPRLQALLWPPIEAATAHIVKAGTGELNKAWCTEIAIPYKTLLAPRYPFNPHATEDVPLGDLADFFKPGAGKIWGFAGAKLQGQVQKVGTQYQGVRVAGQEGGIKGELLSFLNHADEISTVLFPTGAQEPKVQFSYTIHPTPGLALVSFEVDGQRFDYRNGPEESRTMIWPAQGGAKGARLHVRAINGEEETIQKEGDWGLFRLLETGKVKGVPTGNNFSMSWPMLSQGVQVTIDFRSARTQAPFFGVPGTPGKPRLMEPFRNGSSSAPSLSGSPCN
jgi:type VI secretion system protein ImpL